MIHAQKGSSQSEGMASTRNLEAVNRKRGRAVEGTGLENRQWETIREFESHRFRHIINKINNLYEFYGPIADLML